MTFPNITVVGGVVGCGKTTWISQQLALVNNQFNFSQEKILYFSPATGKVPIDQNRLAADFPGLQVFNDGQEIEFFKQIESASAVYMELGFYLETSAVTEILGNIPYHAVAVLPPQIKDSEWQTWANQMVTGAVIDTNISPTQVWRVPTNGQVIDEDSLEEFWYEITHDAYGHVTRAKGIFDVNDGRAIYADYVTGVPSTDFLELDLPRHLEGRPQRFSGLEVVGVNLDELTLKQTLQDCLLSEQAIWQYQQQVKQVLLEEMSP
ncbi:MAG TPA: GTP-binding protein [Nostocaceae cyanobacterium]|nr:GTP-binding protein [Nostocaceae cyanobacterium]